MIRNVPSSMKQLAHDVNGLMACAQFSVDSLALSTDVMARSRALQLQSVIDNTVLYCREIMLAAQEPQKNVKGRIPLDDVLQNVKALLVPASKNVVIKIEASQKAPQIYASDKARLHRILTNLGRNAVHAMLGKNGGKLLFRVWGPPSVLWIDVSDEGPGIGSDAVQLLNDASEARFAHGGRARFGLRTSSALAKDLGGELQVVKTTATGTTFRLSIPRLVPKS